MMKGGRLLVLICLLVVIMTNEMKCFLHEKQRVKLNDQVIQNPYKDVDMSSLPQTHLTDFEVFNANQNPSDKLIYKIIEIDRYKYGQNLTGNVLIIDNPLREHFSVQTSPNGCPGKASTTESATFFDCHLALNAGFFNVQTGDCIGNVISNGTIVQVTDKVNANFGLNDKNQFVIGYLDSTLAKSHTFSQLVTGVIWLLRDGEIYVNQSYEREKPNYGFLTLLAPRVAIGHDQMGRLIYVQVNGYETTRPGLNLWDFASICKEFGMINAVNLDGGGSTTLVERQASGNYKIYSRCTDECLPGHLSEHCPNAMDRCQRSVTTISCLK